MQQTWHSQSLYKIMSSMSVVPLFDEAIWKLTDQKARDAPECYWFQKVPLFQWPSNQHLRTVSAHSNLSTFQSYTGNSTNTVAWKDSQSSKKFFKYGMIHETCRLTFQEKKC